MATMTVTSKGQVTLRKDVLRHLGIKPGEKIKHRPGAERAFLAAQPGDHRGDLIDFDEAAHGDLAQHVVDVGLRHLREHRLHARQDPDGSRRRGR